MKSKAMSVPSKFIAAFLYICWSLRAEAFLTVSPPSVQSIFNCKSSALSSSADANRYQPIVESIDELFPPQGLDQRIALSRKDGYWEYIRRGDEPPQEFVYGEFDVEFFSQVVDRAIEIFGENNAKVFCDLGSGTGRLVLTAAALHNWDLVRGIELLPGIHEQAVENMNACKVTATIDPTSPPPPSTSPQESVWKQYRTLSPSDDWLNQLSRNFDEEETEPKLILPPSSTQGTGTLESPSDTASDDLTSNSAKNLVLGAVQKIPLAPIELSCGSFDDPYEFFGDADIVFCFSSAMPYHIIVNMARACGRQCRPGSLIITTEYALPEGGTIDPFPDDPNVPHGNYELELVEELNGACDATGGESTVFIHRITTSLGTGKPVRKPNLTVSDIAYNAIQNLKANDPKKFLRKVSNQMMFVGFPDSWRPKLDD